MSTIDSFIKKVEAATKARSKEIRISLEEAQVMVIEIAGMLKKENDLLDKIVKLQDNVAEVVNTDAPSGDIKIDGGSF